MMRTRVYVAGAISRGDLRENIRKAREAGTALFKAGYSVFLPHLSCFWTSDVPEATGGGFSHSEWLDMDLSWVGVSHAVFRLPGESTGADMETAHAESLGIPVFHDLDTLLANLESRQTPPCRLCQGKGSIERPVICGPNDNAYELRRVADEAYGLIPCPSCRPPKVVTS